MGLLCVVCCVCEMSLKEEEEESVARIGEEEEESEARIALNAIAQVEVWLALPPCGQVRHNFVMFQNAIAQGKDLKTLRPLAQECARHLDEVDGLTSRLQAHIRTLREAITNMVIEARINQCESTCSTCDKVQEDWLGEDDICNECDK